VYKPAASGCRADGDELISDDALALWEAAGSQGQLMRVSPQRFKSPVAPNLAARAEGRKIDADLLRSGLDYWRECSEVVLIEGAGGLMSPITDDEYIADLAYDFGYPLIVVARNQIGVINQVLQTLIVANTFRRGLNVAGVVLNHPQRRPDDPSIETNRRELAQRAVPPILAEVLHGEQKLPEVDWFRLAEGRSS
jgi:dethiobiotin synthetase